jgi:hypothetical protein
LVRTAEGIELRLQHPVTDSVVIGERLRIGLVPTAVMAEEYAS